MKFRDPASVYLVCDDKLPGLIIDFDDEILSEVLERDLGTESRSVAPYLICPFFKLSIMVSDAIAGESVVRKVFAENFPGNHFDHWNTLVADTTAAMIIQRVGRAT